MCFASMSFLSRIFTGSYEIEPQHAGCIKFTMAHKEWLSFGLTSTGNVDVETPEIQINYDNSEHGSFGLDRVAGVMALVPRQICHIHVNGKRVGRYTGEQAIVASETWEIRERSSEKIPQA
jgi:hypothetical protein